MATIKLTDAQRVILAAAAARPSGLVLPIPKSLGNNRGTLGVLLKSLLADSWSPSDPSFPGEELWRDTPELGRTTLTVSDEGLKAIGTEPDINEDRAMPSGTSQTPVICDAVGQPTVQAGPKADSKPGVMISALRQVTVLAMSVTSAGRKPRQRLDIGNCASPTDKDRLPVPERVSARGQKQSSAGRVGRTYVPHHEVRRVLVVE
ncbi:hypothetical protein [Devosia sp. CN2-171]|uniref:hypothetical protein n=1 Tax=Devosia sp. CN2-171 TaxID=3400909 RepID=UPI003BF787DE